jgi:RNA polymerase sigma-70 factor (ECF subfamily)
MTSSEIIDKAVGFEQNDLLAMIPLMRGFARLLCRDSTQADDLTQDALVSALKHQGAFTAGTNLKAWLFAIVRNQFYSDRRRSWRNVPLDQTLAEETLEAVSNPMAALELEDVRSAMHQLSHEQREALILIAVAGLPYDAAALICGCAQGTIKSRVSRARQRLEEILAGGEPIERVPVQSGGAMVSLFADAAARLDGDVAA